MNHKVMLPQRIMPLSYTRYMLIFTYEEELYQVGSILVGNLERLLKIRLKDKKDAKDSQLLLIKTFLIQENRLLRMYYEIAPGNSNIRVVRGIKRLNSKEEQAFQIHQSLQSETTQTQTFSEKNPAITVLLFVIIFGVLLALFSM